MPRTGANLTLALQSIATERDWLDRPAIIAAGQTRSYTELFTAARACAARLSAAAVQSGNRVLVLLPDGFDVVATLLGAMWLGAIPVLGNPRLPGPELTALVRRCEPSVLVCTETIAQTVREIRRLAPEDLLHSVAATAVPASVVQDHDPGYGLFTSGTTGEPKLCFHAHADPLVHDNAYGKPVLGLRPGDTVHSVSKTYFAYGLGNSVWYPLLNGATAVLEPDHPTADGVLATLSEHQVDILFAVPSFYAKLLAHPDHRALARLRIAVTAGEVLPLAIEQQFTALHGPVLLNGIGSTEVGQAFASNSIGAYRPGTVGHVLPPYRIRVVDSFRNQVPAGIEGSLEVAGPTVVHGHTSAEIPDLAPQNLWHRTGDAAILDADGFLTVLGRVDDVEIVGGINIHPTEVEQAISDCPLIADVAVCAVTDNSAISRLIAFVVPATPHTDPDELSARIRHDLRDRLAGFKVPHTVVAVTDLPRTDTGKLRRNLVRAAAREYLTGTGQFSG